MTELERTEQARLEGAIEERVREPKIGKVGRVYEHKEDDDGSNIEVDVNILGEEMEHRAIPYQHVAGGEVHVPRVGDKVMVEYLAGQRERPVARNILYTNVDRPPISKSGMWRKTVPSGDSPAGSGDLYIESYTDYDGNPAVDDVSGLSPETSWIRIAKKSNDGDTDDLPMNIEVFDDASGSAAHVTVELEGSWGMKFDLSDGSFKLLDQAGYGIVSDGSGNFTWHHKDVNFSEGTTDSL